MPSGTSGSRPFGFGLRTPSLSLSTLLVLALAFTPSVLAQQDVQLRPSSGTSSFPSCGVSCGVLTQADDACTPPTAQTTNRQTYVSCFCQSALLTTFKSDASTACSDTCTSSDDRQKLTQWYTDFCNSGGKTGANTDSNDKDTSNNNSNNSGNSNSSNNANNSTASAADSASASTNQAPQSWWDGHYKWVIMIIVLAVGFTAIAVGGMWFKRRYDRRHPNLYHAAQGQSDSKVFQDPNRTSLVPALVPRARSVNTVSFASSSRTDVAPPKPQGPSPSPLRGAQGAESDLEIREAPR